MKNAGLLLIAILLAAVLFPLGVLTTLAVALSRGSLSKVLGYLSVSALSTALAIDIMGNVMCRDLLNRVMRKREGYPFGGQGETISRVLGKNKAADTLTDLGRALANLLNWMDKRHVEESAKPIYLP